MLVYNFFCPFLTSPNQGAAMSINSIGCTLSMVHVWGKFVTVNCFNSYPALKKLKLFVNVLYTLSSVQCSRSVSKLFTKCIDQCPTTQSSSEQHLSNFWAPGADPRWSSGKLALLDIFVDFAVKIHNLLAFGWKFVVLSLWWYFVSKCDYHCIV